MSAKLSLAVIRAFPSTAWERAKVEDLCRLAGPDGTLIIAGFKDTQTDPLLTSYQARGWSVLEHRSRDSWAPEPPPELSYTWVAWLLVRPH